MKLLERATIIHYHRHRIASFGAGTVEALGWKGPESQTRRFEVIAGAVDLAGAVVLDVGCGHGDLRGFLDGRFRDFSYVGIDQMPEFIERARDRYGGLPRTSFFQLRIPAQVDHPFRFMWATDSEACGPCIPTMWATHSDDVDLSFRQKWATRGG